MTPEEAQLLALKELENGLPHWTPRFQRVKEVCPDQDGWVCVIDTIYRGDTDLWRQHCLVKDDGSVHCILDVEEVPADIRQLMRQVRRARYEKARKLRARRVS